MAGIFLTEDELQGIGIYTFTYNTSIFSGNYHLSDAVDALKEHLLLDGLCKRGQNLIFVCHSMGGIVGRKFIVDQQAELIQNKIGIGLFLLASPSLGSEYANWITKIAKCLGIQHAQADILRFGQDNAWLNDLDKAFKNLKESGKLKLFGKELIEDSPLILKRLLRKQLVEPLSGAKYFGDSYKVPQSDHKSISKPVNQEAIQHRLLCKFIKNVESSCVSEYATEAPRAKTSAENISEGLTRPEIDFIDRYLTLRLDDALSSFASQSSIWVDPILSKSPEVAVCAESSETVDISSVIVSNKSTIIQAPPQFGLTCLGYYLAREAWRNKPQSLWLMLDSKSIKPNPASIRQAVENQLEQIGKNIEDIHCLVIDSWASYEKNSFKIITKLIECFPEKRVIILQTIDPSYILNMPDGKLPAREYDVIYLWSLSRAGVRKIVASYNDAKNIGNESAITKRILSDIDVLNIHRTPLNCLTLLKVCELDFDESPVNRTEMIRRVLFLLFNDDDVPTYKVKPDLKDCEYVLGYFCEKMVRDNLYLFSREGFISTISEFCKKNLIDLELQVVFDVLYSNSIIVKKEGGFSFKFSYWVYYFVAQRMHFDQDFANFVLCNLSYTRFPEVIEFYTGIDRHRENALLLLTEDLRQFNERIVKITSLDQNINPYRAMKWHASPEAINKMQGDILGELQDSGLPESIKDAYADQHYDRTRPYKQDIHDFLSDKSFGCMMQAMRASSRALRNSDYVSPKVKRELLQEIMKCWTQASNILLILMPILAHLGRASFEGQGFVLRGQFGETPEERFKNILMAIPYNIVLMTQDDLFSQKMGPLLIDQFNSETEEFKRHILARLLIAQRPRGWGKHTEKYIESIPKNSFYLLDIFHALRDQYRFSYVSRSTLSEIGNLIKMAAAKHQFGSKSPGEKAIKKILGESVLPVRKIDSDNDSLSPLAP